MRGSWDRDRLREEIRKRRLSEGQEESVSGPPPLEAQKGILDTYRIVMLEGRLQIDLGFSSYLELSPKDAKQLAFHGEQGFPFLEHHKIDFPPGRIA